MNLSGADPAKMMEAIKPMAERRARVRLLLERIAAAEGINVDDAELDATLGRIAVSNRRDVAEVKKFYQEHDLMEVLRRQLRDEKTMKLLLENAVVTASEPAGAEPEKD